MGPKYKILSCSAECAPFAKTGGLGDVVGATAKYLCERGHDARVVLPLYRKVIKDVDWSACDWFTVNLRRWGWTAGDVIVAAHKPNGDHGPVYYFVENHEFFNRNGIYGDARSGFADNQWRFALLAVAAVGLPETLGWAPDIYHAHDWHAGLVAPLIRRHWAASKRPDLPAARIVHTIHNLAHRGVYGREVLGPLDLPDDVMRPETGEYHGAFSYLKAGLAYSDAITTVSPGYAREMLTPEGGMGFEGFLRHRAGRFIGILNGIDESEWNPATDKYLPSNYSVDDLTGKSACKQYLQEMLGLAPRSEVPLIGMVSRLDAQKGHDLLIEILPALMRHDVQLVVLGSGSEILAKQLKTAESIWPRKMRVKIGYDNALSHRIEAGSDLFLMPSRFEPCGLNQMYSMKYGTAPIVRRTGGLRDSVRCWEVDADYHLGDRTDATGFGFELFSGASFLASILTAVKVFNDSPAIFRRIQLNGMSQNLDWHRRIAEYERLFDRVHALPQAAPRWF